MSVVASSEGGPPADVSVNRLQMKGCKEATIGTRIDLQGKFVVNQFLRFDNPPPPSELSAIRNALVKDATKKRWWEKLPLKSLLVGLAVAVLLCAGIVTTTLLVTGNGNRSNNDDIDDLPMNYSARLISRSDWNAADPDKQMYDLLVQPPPYVVVAHTVTDYCEEPIFCENILRSIQSDHIANKGYGDIGYNFLIGMDGFIYEGRGWGVYGAHTYGLNCASLGVAFIGDFDVIQLNRKAKDAFDLLMDEGVKQNQLAVNYTLIDQDQAFETSSPGLNIKKQIRKWKNYGKLKEKICEKL